jgi:hypothetical protein
MLGQADFRRPPLNALTDDEMSTTSVPVQLRHQIDRWVETWLKAKFSRLLELRAKDPGPFNYLMAVSSEWRGRQGLLPRSLPRSEPQV